MDGCQHCELIKDLMLMAKQEHVIYTLDKDFNIKEFESQFKTKYFPQVVAAPSEHIGGAKETVRYFKENQLV
tara:strand:- start:2006 stop:2221 length:216 start_codon:yes stop_codon:yes gene_type:complete